MFQLCTRPSVNAEIKKSEDLEYTEYLYISGGQNAGTTNTIAMRLVIIRI